MLRISCDQDRTCPPSAGVSIFWRRSWARHFGSGVGYGAAKRAFYEASMEMFAECARYADAGARVASAAGNFTSVVRRGAGSRLTTATVTSTPSHCVQRRFASNAT